jgi:[calcium/calmodulin-dependent protein kinase] kinase
VPGLKNNKKSIDTTMKNNKLINSFTPNVIINDINNKTYNNKTFNLNIINSNSNNLTNLNNNTQMKTLSNNTITECPNLINKTNTVSINLNIQTTNNNNLKDDTNINYGKFINTENKTGIYETDNVTITYDKKTGNKIVNEFYFMDTIGRGAYSKVKKCINLKTKEEFAVKILNKRLLRKKKKSYGKTKEGTLKINYMIEDAINEINIYKSFPGTNKNVLKLYQILNDNKKDKTYLIMELAEKGPLVTLNEKAGVFCINSNYRDDIYDEKLIKTWIYDTANGLKFLHDNNIVHRDIKSDNILLDKNGHCKIADFGCSIKLKNGQPDLFSKTEGNMYFFPPEFVDGKSKKQFGYKPVDIWAFGVSIYTCIFKTLPFLPENRENVVELFKEIREAKFDYNRNGIKISKEMETLLSHILDKDPQKRFTAKDIVEYPWLNSK